MRILYGISCCLFMIALLIGYQAPGAFALDETLQGYIVQLETGLHGAGDDGVAFAERLSSLKQAIFALNDIQRYEYSKDFPDFREGCNNAALQLRRLQSHADEIVSRSDFTTDEMRFLDEYAYLTWYFQTTYFPLRPVLKRDGDDVFHDCSVIHNAIAVRTEFESVKNDVELCELGLNSRKQLSVFRLQLGPYDRPSQDEYLIPLKQYIDLLNENGVRSKEIDETIADARSLECQIDYALHEYGRCIERVDEYFGEILANLTPESPESNWTVGALVAFDFKIQALATPIRPDIFDRRMLMDLFQDIRRQHSPVKSVASALKYVEEKKKLAERYPVSEEDAAVLCQALNMAKRLASFGDRQAWSHSHFDILKKRWQLVFDIQDALDLRDEKFEDMARLVDEFPRRFSSYQITLSIEESRRDTVEKRAKRSPLFLLLNGVAVFSLLLVFYSQWSQRKANPYKIPRL